MTYHSRNTEPVHFVLPYRPDAKRSMEALAGTDRKSYEADRWPREKGKAQEGYSLPVDEESWDDVFDAEEGLLSEDTGDEDAADRDAQNVEAGYIMSQLSAVEDARYRIHE